MRYFLAIVGLIAVSHAMLARPAEIILLRHGEKPADDRNPDLSARGWQRANALPAFLTNSPAIVTNGIPVALFAPRATRHGHSRRAQQTLAPTGQLLHLAVQTPCEAQDFRTLAGLLLRDRQFDDKTVVVCWVHDYIPDLAAALGVRSPPRWKGSDFDHAWIIHPGTKGADLTIIPESILPGDSHR